MNKPTVSVITLTKNRARLLERNFASLVGQLGNGDEIVLIDNGSTDDTRDVIRTFRKKLPIRAYQNVAGKYPHLYNTGIRHAQGDIVVFFDDDCTAVPDFIRNIRATHTRHPGEVIQGMTDSVPRDNIYAAIMGDHYRAFLKANTIRSPFLRILDNKNASVSRQLIRKLGGFNESLECGSEDIELGIRLRASGIRIRFVPRIRAFHHERTTLAGFFHQHLRFARCEGRLDRTLPPHERMGISKSGKLPLQLRYAAAREWGYVKRGDIVRAIQLPLLYILLASVRIWGYATSR